MKRPLNRGLNNYSIRNNKFLEGLISNMTSHVGKIIFCLVFTGMFLSGDDDRLQPPKASISTQKLVKKVDRTAANISIRILARNFLGSGFIIRRNQTEYIAVTNQHVLRAGEAPYTIETKDGRTYQAEIITDTASASDRYDLAFLRFKTDEDTVYQTAKIGSSYDLKVGEPVYAAGFPYQESNSPPLDTTKQSNSVVNAAQINNSPELALKPGRVAIVLDRALEEGYQIGYTNNVKKGMSGGPLLNLRGEAIGVNGKHAYPLWESPEIYQDGSEPCPALQELITRLSLAIPIEKSIELATELKSLEPSVSPKYPVQPNSEADQLLITRMQTEAEATERQCREYDRSMPKPNTTLEKVLESP